jgi:hypothetical protein
MTDIRREDLLDCLRKLEQERQRCREEAANRDLGSTVTHGYLGVADGIEFALFGIDAEEIEEETVQSAEAKPEKKMAPSKGEEFQAQKKMTS